MVLSVTLNGMYLNQTGMKTKTYIIIKDVRQLNTTTAILRWLFQLTIVNKRSVFRSMFWQNYIHYIQITFE